MHIHDNDTRVDYSHNWKCDNWFGARKILEKKIAFYWLLLSILINRKLLATHQ